MSLRFELDYEERQDRWICDCLDFPGCMAYGISPAGAAADAIELAQDHYWLQQCEGQIDLDDCVPLEDVLDDLK